MTVNVLACLCLGSLEDPQEWDWDVPIDLAGFGRWSVPTYILMLFLLGPVIAFLSSGLGVLLQLLNRQLHKLSHKISPPRFLPAYRNVAVYFLGVGWVCGWMERVFYRIGSRPAQLLLAIVPWLVSLACIIWMNSFEQAMLKPMMASPIQNSSDVEGDLKAWTADPNERQSAEKCVEPC
jgi:hypothetical protein